MNEFLNFIKKEQQDMKFEVKEFKENEEIFKLFIKSLIAQNVWGTTEFYKIYNKRNAILNVAIDTIENTKKFDKFNIEK
jgi:carboxyl-terminal processing protease